MAYADWLLIEPGSGAGKKDVNLKSAEKNNGRDARITIMTGKATGADDDPVDVNQAGRPEYVDIQEAISSNKEGGVVTITGHSNSKKLTFSFGTGSIDLELPSTYKANSVDTENGANIIGDPGASDKYNFSIGLTVPENTSIQEFTRQLIVTAEGGMSDTCVITQLAGEPYINITPKVVNLDWEGNPVTVHVDSNTNWTIE